MSVTPAIRPVIDRSDVVTALVAELPTDPARQQEVADTIVAGWQAAEWPAGLLARTLFTSTDGTRVITYNQWSATDSLTIEDAGIPYEIYLSVRGGAIPDPPPVTECFPGAFFPTPNREAARKWVDDLLAAEVANEGAQREYPGALAAHFHIASDGSGVFLLSEWTSEEEAVEHIAEVIQPILDQLGTPDAGLRYRHHTTLGESR
jgi:hypothetical protein